MYYWWMWRVAYRYGVWWPCHGLHQSVVWKCKCRNLELYLQNNPFPRTAGDKYNTILFRHICRASLWWDRSHNFLEFLLRNLSPNILHLHLSIIHLLDWTDDKTIFCRHIVIGLFPIPTKILFVFRQWVCSHSIYHGLHYYIQAERIFGIHPYAVLELKQLTSKEAAVKATPTPTTPVHP